eukprot:scaffold3143_cov104-Isochrysis_galbana.AAC.2
MLIHSPLGGSRGERGHRMAPHFPYSLSSPKPQAVVVHAALNHPPTKIGLNKEKGWGDNGGGE